MGLHEKFHRKRLEMEKGRVEDDTKRDDEPITHAKLPKVRENDFVGGDLAETVMVFGPYFHDPVDDGSDQAQAGKGHRDNEGRAPVGIGGSRPSRGVKGGKRS